MSLLLHGFSLSLVFQFLRELRNREGTSDFPGMSDYIKKDGSQQSKSRFNAKKKIK